MSAQPILSLKKLSVEFETLRHPIRAVAGIDLDIWPGEIVGIIGESGSGKSSLATAAVRALPKSAKVSGEIWVDGRLISDISEEEMQKIRGRKIAMILQNPMTSLDPLFTIGSQLREVLLQRVGLPASQVYARSIELLKGVHLTSPETRLNQYPHELSGGMRQRVVIALATATTPPLLLADEPTTALDTSIQEEVLMLFRKFRDERGSAIAIITHDLGVVRRICDRIVVMYAGSVVEDGPVADVFGRPAHPYTKALLESIPQIHGEEVVIKPIPGQVPDLAMLGPGCPFAPRCAYVDERCYREFPDMSLVDTRKVHCWNAGAIE
jgi:oligopeptide/dipeptide ABC transporter ATP-binding protein